MLLPEGKVNIGVNSEEDGKGGKSPLDNRYADIR